MVEYLERKAVEEALEKHLNPDIYYGFILDDIPAADVQPVVRCNECNLYDGVHEVYGFASCDYWMQMTRWDDYCSHGVRKDGEDNG